jgi:hypothetical protein
MDSQILIHLNLFHHLFYTKIRFLKRASHDTDYE